MIGLFSLILRETRKLVLLSGSVRDFDNREVDDVGLGSRGDLLLMVAEFDEGRLVRIVEETHEFRGKRSLASKEFLFMREHHGEQQVHDSLPLGDVDELGTTHIKGLEKEVSQRTPSKRRNVRCGSTNY